MRTCDQQPVALQNARSRIASYRGRLREIIAKMQSDGATDSEAYTRRLNVTLCEVAEILGHVQHEPAVNWIEILFQAQDATLTALQELRLMARTPPLISADERMNAQ
jgi:hypothetical protein